MMRDDNIYGFFLRMSASHAGRYLHVKRQKKYTWAQTHERAEEMTHPLRKERRSETLPMITWLSGLGERGESIKNKSFLRLLPLPSALPPFPPICPPPPPPSSHPHLASLSFFSLFIPLFLKPSIVPFRTHPGVRKWLWQAWFVCLCASLL